MVKVAHIMHQGASWIAPDMPLADIAGLIDQEDIGALPVGEDDRLIGMVTDRDIAVRAFGNSLDPAQLKARDVMSKPIIYCTANEELAAAGTAAKENTSTAEAQNREEAQSQLPAARDSYDTALAAYNARAESVASGNAGAIGLLSQISGLNRLSEKEPTILWAHILIAALFFMIELLPVLVKVLTSYGEPSLYEKAAAIRKQVALDKVTAEGFTDRAAIVQTQSSAVSQTVAQTP